MNNSKPKPIHQNNNNNNNNNNNHATNNHNASKSNSSNVNRGKSRGKSQRNYQNNSTRPNNVNRYHSHLNSISNSTIQANTIPSNGIIANKNDNLSNINANQNANSNVLRGRSGAPQARHPLADHLHRRILHRHRRRQPPLRDHLQAVAQLEQLVQFLTDHQQRTARVAQAEQLAADLRRGADVHAPAFSYSAF